MPNSTISLESILLQKAELAPAIRAGLDYLVECGDLTFAAILVQFPGESKPVLLLERNFPSELIEQLWVTESELNLSIRKVASGEISSDYLSDIDVQIVPLISAAGFQGALACQVSCRMENDPNQLWKIAFSLGKRITNSLRIETQGVRSKVDSNSLGPAVLLRSRNTLRALFDNLPASLYIIDHHYTLVALNKSRADRAGVRPSQLVGQKCHQVFFKREEPCPGCRVAVTLVMGSGTSRMARYPEGRDAYSDWEVKSYPIYDSSYQVVQAILMETDVTEKHHLELSLIQSEKLAAIGQLAAGVAHEINNPLSAIIANAQILERDMPADPDLQEAAHLIKIAGARASEVVNNLLGYARKDQYEFDRTDINDSVRSALALLAHRIEEKKASIILNFDEGLPPAYASHDHLQGLWMNLIRNALDAVRDGEGIVKVTTRKLEREFRIDFEDNGIGICEKDLNRIFEPFFTTKSPGQGTGLGLSLCQRVAKQHGGSIEVISQEGKGACFTVRLPERAIP